jgi:7-carboxy-7-deazaguanine synthase
VNGAGGGRFGTARELAHAVRVAWPESASQGRRFVVCTGGEPLLQLDDAAVAELHKSGFDVAVETNGTRPPLWGLDWVTVSPKAGAEPVLRSGDELKLVFPQDGLDPARFEDFDFQHFFLQPMDGPGLAHHTRLALRYCLEHPRWRLGLQIQKILKIP